MQAIPIKFIKDAAKSVRRACKQEFTKVTDSVLDELAGISCLVVTMFALRREDDQDILHLMCAHRDEVAICPKCGSFTSGVHEEKERCVRHLDIWGKRRLCIFFRDDSNVRTAAKYSRRKWPSSTSSEGRAWISRRTFIGFACPTIERAPQTGKS